MRGEILNRECPDILIRSDKGGSWVLTDRHVCKHCLRGFLQLFHLTLPFPPTLCVTFPPFPKINALLLSCRVQPGPLVTVLPPLLPLDGLP